MKHELNVAGSEVPKRWGVAWNPSLNPVCAFSCSSVRTYTHTAFANAKREAIRTAKVMVMAGAAGDVPVTGQNLVIEKEPTKFSLLSVELDEIVIRKRFRKFDCKGG